MLREGVERNPGPASIGQTLEWYKTTLQNGKVSEAKIKSEALRFFKLSKRNEHAEFFPHVSISFWFNENGNPHVSNFILFNENGNVY